MLINVSNIDSALQCVLCDIYGIALCVRMLLLGMDLFISRNCVACVIVHKHAVYITVPINSQLLEKEPLYQLEM